MTPEDQMSTFAFETITPSQAASISPADNLTFDSGTASAVTVIYGATLVTLSFGDRSVDFSGQFFPALSQFGHISFPDVSLLYIGDARPDTNQLDVNSGHASGMFGGDGNDRFLNSLPGGLLQGNQGNDTLEASGPSTIYGGQGDDFIEAVSSGSHDNFFQGNKGADQIVGSDVRDTILGGQGDDRLVGSGGIDFLNGNLGDDRIDGSGQMFGEDGNDIIDGGTVGANSIFGGAGDDLLRGDGGVDTNGATGATNVISGDDGDDFISTNSPKADTLSGGAGDDTIFDFLGGGTDSLNGGDGNDNLSGNAAAEIINGGTGLDTINGGGGIDFISGGAGADKFVFGAFGNSLSSAARITDWSGAEDFLSFSGYSPNASDLTTGTAADFAAALTLATTTTRTTHFTFVEVQVGADVFVFAGGSGAVTSVVNLVGRNLTDFAGHNLI
jgi:Ca2+-binding RTX toxin-like protein